MTSRYERQERLFGAEGQALIRQSRVGVVGLGGIGSHIAQQLSYLGVGALTLVDPDTLDTTNLNRVVGATQTDVGSKKTSIAHRHIKFINSDIIVAEFPNNLLTAPVLAKLTTCTHIFGCVDNDGPRLVLNELCVAYEIPYFDVASEIVNDGSDYGGRVSVIFDKAGCLYCRGEISTEEAREYLAPSSTKIDVDNVYGVHRLHLPDSGPSVVSINGTVASLAVTEFMVTVTGLRRPHRARNYNGKMAIVTIPPDNISAKAEHCYYCKSIRGIRERANLQKYLPCEE